MGLTRREAYSRWGLIREIEPLTESAYKFFEWLEEQKPNIGENASHLWHVSFHGSQFPGDNPYACGRRALYRMMDLPRESPSRMLRASAEAGKDIENRIVIKWYLAGYLLTPPPPPIGDKQFEMEDPEYRLTSTADAIVIHPNERSGKVVEVKTRFHYEIEKMIMLCGGPLPAHVNQLKCQIGLAHEKGEWHVRRCYNTGRLAVKLGNLSNGNSVEVCPEHGGTKCLREETLEPVERGFLYYASRDRPEITWEYMFEYDPEFMAEGRKQLAMWMKWWDEGHLPQVNFSDKRFSHPMNWTWTKSKKMPDSPCEWCDFGDICRTDHREAVKRGKAIKLTDSAGIEAAEEVRSKYDLDLIRAAVEQRWIAA